MTARRAFLGVVAALFLAYFIAATYLVVRFQVTRLRSASMEPTIHDGTIVVVDRFAYRAGPPQRGDVVAISGVGPFLPLLVGRVVAVAGDRFAVHNGRAVVNGRPDDHGPIARYELGISDYDIVVDGKRIGESDVVTVSDWTSPDTVPPGCYVVLGDNRNKALDSHEWGFLCPNRIGLLSQNDPARLIGRVILR